MPSKLLLANFFSLFRVIPVTVEIAKAGGFYKRDYGKSHGVGLANALTDVETSRIA